MSTLAKLIHLPRYARNIQRLRQVTAVVVRYGFGHVLIRTRLDRYAGFFNRGMALAEPDEHVAELQWEQRVRLALEALGPTFIKLGQVAATRPDLIPMSLIFELRKLQDNVGGFAYEQVREVVRSEFGREIEDLYGSFDPVPIAAASIAQVHRATLKTGEQVVVKVQRPGLEKIIQTDLDLLQMMTAALEERLPEVQQFRPAVAIDEFARNLRRETDFNNADNPHMHLPITYPALCTKRLITMEFIDGCKVTDGRQLDEWQVDRRKIAEVGTHLFIKSVFEHGFFHADPHPGNFFVLPDGRIALIDFGSMGSIDSDTIDELLTFLVSLLLNDPEMLVTQFVDLGLVDDTVNVRQMSGEVSEIMRRYNGVTLEKLDIGAFIAEVFEAVVRYQVRVPAELILIGKAISTMEGIAQELYPNYDPLASVRPYLVQLYVRRVLDPKTYSKRIYRVLHDWWGLVRVVPGEVRGLLRRAKSGELTFQIRDPDAELLRARNERTVNRAMLAGYSMVAWGLFTWVLPQALEKPAWSALWWYSLGLAVQGLGAGAMATLSWLRSREL
jgi:ubiquinone biosynthesis protein